MCGCSVFIVAIVFFACLLKKLVHCILRMALIPYKSFTSSITLLSEKTWREALASARLQHSLYMYHHAPRPIRLARSASSACAVVAQVFGGIPEQGGANRKYVKSQRTRSIRLVCQRYRL